MSTARFAPELRNAAEARRFVESELRLDDVGEEALFQAQLVATEFVTNAVRHGDGPIELSVARRDGYIRIEARDGSTAIPTPPPVETPTRHRGVLLIEDVCEHWGVDVEDSSGKVVWCEVRAPDVAA